MKQFQWMLLVLLCLPSLILSDHTQKNKREGRVNCPEIEEILPCICYNFFDVSTISCSEARTIEDIRAAFMANFTTKEFDTFRIDDNKVLKEFESNVFNGVTFKDFYFNQNFLEKVSIKAFEDSSEIIENINLIANHITQISFETEKSFPSLGSIFLSHNNLTEFPFESLKKFPNLWTFDIDFNPLGSIPVESFQETLISRLSLSGTVNGELTVGTFANQTRLEWLWVTSNNLMHIPEGLFVTGSSAVDSIFLNDNGIVSIEPNAFDLKHGLLIMLGGNYLTTIEESVWREPFESGVRISLSDDNPLECGCNVAWCVNDPALKQQVSEYTVCQDGREFKYLFPEDFVDC